jgi:hypothetical protein
MKTGEVSIRVLRNQDVPFSDELSDSAQRIADEAKVALEDGGITTIEAAGHYSLASVLEGMATGKMSYKKSFDTLRSLAEKKTPAPVQRIEQHQTVDMRSLLVTAVAENPKALEDVVAIAITAREQIREKLNSSDAALALLPEKKTHPQKDLPLQGGDTLTPDDQDDFSQADIGDWTPGSAPVELRQLKGNNE